MNKPARIEFATDDDLDAVRGLIHEYAESLGIDLTYQDFEREMAELPGAFAPPRGALLVARADHGLIGCVALRPIDSEACEMKRLYVLPAARGLGVGTALVDAILAEAVRLGYSEMKLDTLDSLTSAIALYRSRGFEVIPAYYDTPIGCTLFMSKSL